MTLPKYLLIVSAALLASCANSSREAQVQAAVDLGRDHFKNTAIVKDDSLDITATITTRSGLQAWQGLDSNLWGDNFLRGFVDKKSGRTTMQVYQILRYQTGSWNFYQTVNYETPNGPQSQSLSVISRDVKCSGSRYVGCTYEEHVAFTVPDDILRTIGAGYRAGQNTNWRFKFSPKSGSAYTTGLSAAEIAGFLDAIDSYRTARGFTDGAPK